MFFCLRENPPGLFERSDLYIRRRWMQVQYMAELFWKRWTSEYLLVMQERQKWTRPRKSFSPGDVVLIADATAPRGSWMMGQVLSTKSDSKGLVRSVCVQTKTSSLGETNNKDLPAPRPQSRIITIYSFLSLSILSLFCLFLFQVAIRRRLKNLQNVVRDS